MESYSIEVVVVDYLGGTEITTIGIRAIDPRIDGDELPFHNQIEEFLSNRRKENSVEIEPDDGGSQRKETTEVTSIFKELRESRAKYMEEWKMHSNRITEILEELVAEEELQSVVQSTYLKSMANEVGFLMEETAKSDAHKVFDEMKPETDGEMPHLKELLQSENLEEGDFLLFHVHKVFVEMSRLELKTKIVMTSPKEIEPDDRGDPNWDADQSVNDQEDTRVMDGVLALRDLDLGDVSTNLFWNSGALYVQIESLVEGIGFCLAITRGMFEELDMDLFRKVIWFYELPWGYLALHNSKLHLRKFLYKVPIQHGSQLFSIEIEGAILILQLLVNATIDCYLSKGVVIVKCDPNDVVLMSNELSNLVIGSKIIWCEARVMTTYSIVVIGLDMKISQEDIYPVLRAPTNRQITTLFLCRRNKIDNPPLMEYEKTILPEIPLFLPSGDLENYVRVWVLEPKLKDNLMRATIASDEGWFMDVFIMPDNDGNNIIDERILGFIQNLGGHDSCFASSMRRLFGVKFGMVHASVELIGSDLPGRLLSEVSGVLTNQNCNMGNSEVLTHNTQVGVVIHVMDKETGGTIIDLEKLSVVKRLLCNVLKGSNTTKEADHLSLISVIEIPCSEYISSSESFGRVIAKLHELRMRLKLLKIESGAYCIASLEESRINMFRTLWHHSKCTLEPKLFDKPEKQYNGEEFRWERRFLLDRTNSALPSIFQDDVNQNLGVMPKLSRAHFQWKSIQDAVKRLIDREHDDRDILGRVLELAKEDDARLLLKRVMECCPLHVKLWPTLARLETYKNERYHCSRRGTVYLSFLGHVKWGKVIG